MRMRISWVNGWGEDAAGGLVRDPDWNLVLDRVLKACGQSGTVTLDVDRSEGVCLGQLQVVAENGAFWLTLGQDDGEDWVVREYVENGADPKQMRTIQSYSVSSASVCTSISEVIEIFRRFFTTGDVPARLMR